MLRNLKNNNEEDSTNSKKIITKHKKDEDEEKLKRTSRSYVKDPAIHVKKFRTTVIAMSCIVLCCLISVVVYVHINNSNQRTIGADFLEPVLEASGDGKESLSSQEPVVVPVERPITMIPQNATPARQATGTPEEMRVTKSGDPRARITSEGVLGIVSGQVEGKSVASADIFGKGGFASDIDEILSGVGGLRSGGSGGVGRKGVAGIGYGSGYGSGFGGSGTGGIDDLRGALSEQKKNANNGSNVSKPVQTWKRSGLSANTSKLSVGVNESLPLKGVQIAVTVDGFRARVVMDCFYQNTFDRPLEGTFKLRLPHEASPYYFAFGETVLLDKGNERIPFQDYNNKSINLTPEDIKFRRKTSWNNVKEARIVPREKASYAYTETTRRRVDPAIMEWAGADIFNCRVFPLMPGKLHRVVIGYDLDLQSVGSDKLLTVAVPSAQGPVWIDLDMENLSNCSPVLTPSKELFDYGGRQICHFVNPNVSEINVRYLDPGATIISGTAHDNRDYWAASVQVNLPRIAAENTPENAVFLVDASLSSNPDNFNIWLSMMDAILEKNEDVITQFGVLFFNVESYFWKEQAVKNTDANRHALMSFARNQVLEGATDIGQALAAVRTISFDNISDQRTIFLLSDGAITWGEQEPGIVAHKLNKNDRVYSYVTGSSGTDTRLLEHLTRNSGGALFTVSGEDQIAGASRAFRTDCWKIEQIALGDCGDILIKGRPAHIYDQQYLTITGRGTLPEKAKIALTLSHGDDQKSITIPFVQNLSSPLAVRAYGQIATNQLEESGSAVEKYATSYALHFTVPGQTCALLMLESEQDYLRYAIKPENDALAVVSFTVASLLKNSSRKENGSHIDQKGAFVAWLHKLEQLPDIGFKIGLPLELLVNTIPEASFTISPPMLNCSIHSADRIPEMYKSKIRKGEPDYASVTGEAERRRTSASKHDAIKALSSLVECNPGNSEILRDVAYSVMELGLDGHAYHLFFQVAKSRPFEPQTYCALGQVLTNMNNADLAVVFYEVALAAHWNPRYGDFRRIAMLDYLHLLRSIEKKKYQVHFNDFVAERIRFMAQEASDTNADLMVAITWNTDNTDIDLHIGEPSGEECFYSNTSTRIGGAMSQDVTTGYGPEMYVLHKAPSGKYRISVHNYSGNRNRTGVRTTIYTTVYRNWGKPGEKVIRKKVVLQKVKELDQLMEITI